MSAATYEILLTVNGAPGSVLPMEKIEEAQNAARILTKEGLAVRLRRIPAGSVTIKAYEPPKKEEPARLGDTVRGDYMGTIVEGRIVAFDSSGVSIELIEPTDVGFGDLRDGVWTRSLEGWEVTNRANLTADDVGYCMGYTYLNGQ